MLHKTNSSIIPKCTACKKKSSQLFACILCQRRICLACIGNIIGNSDLSEETTDAYPCYKCTALLLVPLLKESDLETFTIDFLEELVCCYSERSQINILRKSGNIIPFLQSFRDIAYFRLELYQLRWDALLINRSEKVKKITTMYYSLGHVRLPQLVLSEKRINNGIMVAIDPECNSSQRVVNFPPSPLKPYSIYQTHSSDSLPCTINGSTNKSFQSFGHRIKDYVQNLFHRPTATSI